MSGEEIVVSPDIFGQFKVKEMRENDFWIGSATPIALKDPRCTIILFYDPVSTDPLLIDIWNNVAQRVRGPVIGAVNVTAREEVMKAFYDTAADLDNPLNDFTINATPTIIVYRSRWPQAYYNGELSSDALIKWITVLACRPGYREPDSTYRGISAVQPDLSVPETRIENYPYPTSSRDFSSFTGEGINGDISTRGGEIYLNEDEQYLSDEGQESFQSEQQYSESTQDIGYFDETA